MNDEILAGIKNAVAHGSTIEEAANSFINAGNPSAEVNEAVSYISRGISPLPSVAKETEVNMKIATAEKKPEASRKLKLILLILTALILLGVTISFLLFRESFLAAIDKLLP